MPLRSNVAAGAVAGALALGALACEESVEEDPAEDLIPEDEEEGED